VFGDGGAGPALHITMCDERCMMINLDPETAAQDARVLKTVVRLNQNNAGVYATAVRRGRINVGDRVSLAPDVPAIR
jgi:MOSC domain-containing protein